MFVEIGELWVVLSGGSTIDYKNETICTKDDAFKWAKELNDARTGNRNDWTAIPLGDAISAYGDERASDAMCD